jgi:dolichol-phosphate mannosyltransferase
VQVISPKDSNLSDNNKSLIIIPTFNERGNISRMIDELTKAVPDTHILIIDDGSPDGTASIVKDTQQKLKTLHLIERQGKLGLGTAYIRGFGWALENGYKKVITMDCDFSHDPMTVPEMLQNLDSNDLVVGSRYVNGIRIMNWPFPRLLLSYGASIYTRLITGIPFFDPTGGFNGYSQKALQALKLDKVFSVGYAFQIELKYKVWSKGLPCKELPIVFWERTEGASKMGKNIIFEAVVNVIRLRLKKMMGTL